MAVARRCDRCTGFYDEYKDVKTFHNGGDGVNGICFGHIKRDKSLNGTVRDTYDLCPTCLEAVYEFVTLRKYKKEEV